MDERQQKFVMFAGILLFFSTAHCTHSLLSRQARLDHFSGDRHNTSARTP